MMLSRFRLALSRLTGRFRRAEDGSILAETVIVLPLMIWAAVAMVAYWDVYRTINRVQTASFAILDVVTRQEQVSGTTYIPQLDDVMNYFLDDEQTPRLRLTVICRDTATNQFRVIWSRSPGGAMSQHNNASLQSIASMIPAMAEETDRAVIIETEIDYVPTIKLGINEWIGVGDQLIREFAVQRLRNQSGRLTLTGTPDPGCI
jgi:hypothetical protein